MKKSFNPEHIDQQLLYLKLPWIRENHLDLAKQASQKNWSHLNFLARLIEGETNLRMDRATQRRIKAARFPVFNLRRFDFVEQKANVIFLGPCGLGKSHLGIALAYEACLNGASVLFASAADIVNTLSAAQHAHRLKTELRKYLKPQILLLDELGFMPIDKHGADLLFQVISQRYEQGSIILTTNKLFKAWPSIFNNDSIVTSAILDRILHHADTVVIHGKSYRMKDRIESP
jgi:DNA replication protein DnaC